MSQVLKLASVGQTTEDLAKQIAWYCKTLGFRLINQERIDHPSLGALVGSPGAVVERARLALGQEILELWAFEAEQEVGGPVVTQVKRVEAGAPADPIRGPAGLAVRLTEGVTTSG